MASPFDFSGRRLYLANSFREWRTAREAAKELGTKTGSVFGLIRRMHGEKILEADSDPAPPTRGTQYRLTHEARIALDETLDEMGSTQVQLGHLANDQRLLLVRGPTVISLQEALADPNFAANIAWTTWLGRSWLIAMSPDSDAHAQRRLATVLESADYECELGRVDDLQSADRSRDQATANLERAGASR